MAFYDEMAQEATALIKGFGQPCTIIQINSAEYDVETGEVAQRTRKIKANCYFNRRYFDFPNYQSGGVAKGASNLIEQGDVLVYLSASAEISRDDLLASILQVGAEKWRIISCQPLKPGNTTIYYQLQARAT